MKKSAVVGNIIIGKAGTYAPSRDLTSPEDRIRFHELRQDAGLILIGGQTARNEPYEKSKQPTLIITRSPITSFSSELLANPHVQCEINQDNLSIAEIIIRESEALWRKYQGHKYLLIEAGPSIITQGLASQLIDTLYVTHSPKMADSNRQIHADFYELLKAGTLVDQYFVHEENQPGEYLFEQYEFWRGEQI